MKKPFSARVIGAWLLPLAVMCMIFCFSAQDGDESATLSNGFILTILGWLQNAIPHWRSMTQTEFITMLSPFIRKGAHVTEYLILFLSLMPLLKLYRLTCRPFVALGITFLYACSDEFHQRFIPGRCGCFRDVLIDCSGALALTLLFLFILYVKHSRQILRNITEQETE